MRNYTINWGRWIALRWFVASWLFHGVHVLDKTEKLYYIICELLMIIILITIFFICGLEQWYLFLLAFVVVHTATWLSDSHWLVGFREVNRNFKGKGIESVIAFSQLSKQRLIRFDSVYAIAIYGSLCRRMYHDRSDMDLRVVQFGHSFRLFWEIQKLRFIGIWKYKIPLDLKLVDSVEYLKKEMRIDEKPIMLFKRDKQFYNEGMDFSELLANPESFRKKN